MGTGAFWNLPSSEPKRQHRFLVDLSNLTSEDGADAYKRYLAKSATKPGFTISSTEHKFLGNTYYYPGTVTWDEVTITFINSIDPDGNKLLYDALGKSGYLRPDQQAAANNQNQPFSTVNKTDALNALGEVSITELDGAGDEVGFWVLKNAFITGAKFGDLDYTGDELLNVEVTIRYDWANYRRNSAAIV